MGGCARMGLMQRIMGTCAQEVGRTSLWGHSHKEAGPTSQSYKPQNPELTRKTRNPKLQKIPKSKATGGPKMQNYSEPPNAELRPLPKPLQQAPKSKTYKEDQKSRVTEKPKIKSYRRPPKMQSYSEPPNAELRHLPKP